MQIYPPIFCCCPKRCAMFWNICKNKSYFLIFSFNNIFISSFWGVGGKETQKQMHFYPYFFGLFPTKNMQNPSPFPPPQPLRSCHIYLKDAHSAELNEKSYPRFFRFFIFLSDG